MGVHPACLALSSQEACRNSYRQPPKYQNISGTGPLSQLTQKTTDKTKAGLEMLAPAGLCLAVKPQHFRALAPWGQQQQGHPPHPATPAPPGPSRDPALTLGSCPGSVCADCERRHSKYRRRLTHFSSWTAACRVSTHFFHLWFPGFLRKGEAVGGSDRHPRAREAASGSSRPPPERGSWDGGPQELAAWC